MFFMLRNANQKNIFDYDTTMMSRILLDTHPEEIINRVKLDVGTPSNFGGVRLTYVSTYTPAD